MPLFDDIRRTVRARGGPIADAFGDAFTRPTQLSFNDLGMGLDDLIQEDARILSLYFNRNFTNVDKKSTGKGKHD